MLENFDKYRNSDGYIDLSKVPIKEPKRERNIYGSRDKIWLGTDCEDKDILFKENMREYEDLKEIFNLIIAEMLGIYNASYDFAILNGKKGIITKDFLEADDDFLPVIILLMSNKGHMISNDLFSVLNALENQKASNESIKKIIQAFFNNHILDIATAQHDRNDSNQGIIKRGNIFLPSLRYDCANSFLSIYGQHKISSFLALNDDQKTRLLSRFKIGRTKFKLFPRSTAKTSIEELISFLYNPIDIPEDRKQFMQEIGQSAEPLISKISNLNIDDGFYRLQHEYRYRTPVVYKRLFNYVINHQLTSYENAKQKVIGH